MNLGDENFFNDTIAVLYNTRTVFITRCALKKKTANCCCVEYAVVNRYGITKRNVRHRRKRIRLSTASSVYVLYFIRTINHLYYKKQIIFLVSIEWWGGGKEINDPLIR